MPGAAISPTRGLPQAKDPEVSLRYFEFHLLRLTGALPELCQCVDCGSVIAPGGHRFSVNRGGALCPACSPAEALVRPLSLRAVKVLRLTRRGSLAETAALTLNESLSAELKSALAHTESPQAHFRKPPPHSLPPVDCAGGTMISGPLC